MEGIWGGAQAARRWGGQTSKTLVPHEFIGELVLVTTQPLLEHRLYACESLGR